MRRSERKEKAEETLPETLSSYYTGQWNGVEMILGHRRRR